MSTKTLRNFQERAVESGVGLFTAAKALLDAAAGDATGRAAAINHNGYLLIEAPTGSGKTLMAGTIVERLSHAEEVVWFWFAPFKGVVGQTVGFLREQFQGLRLRELQEDRSAAGSRRGDVFLTTWQTVATRVKDRRNVRKDGELNPSIDGLVTGLRAMGLRIGVVVDEAHHGFGGDTQAAKFFRSVLDPDYTILVTATPDDAEIRAFETSVGIAELHRIRVSRQDAVDSGLIKSGVKCAAYFVAPEQTGLVDLEATALRDGAAAHRTLKKTLADLGVPLVPLMLVQVDSTEKSAERAKERLLKLGFSESQIAVHTTEEPDAGLLALANDEGREVLVFKMAVALGFDAPRAFTLVTMRASRDSDFGVQLVGRILRVHRRLQGRAARGDLPEALRYGYVFLADPDTQTGLDIAGQRINEIRTEYATVSPATVVVRVGSQPPRVQVTEEGGQTSMLDALMPGHGGLAGSIHGGSVLTGTPPEYGGGAIEVGLDLGAFFVDLRSGESSGGISADGDRTEVEQEPMQGHRYALRSGVPRRFKTQRVPADNEATEEDCARRFLISTRELFEVMRNRIPIERRTLDVFTREFQSEFNFSADLSPEHAALLAQKTLLRSQVFDARELRKALLRKVQAVMREEALPDADDPGKVAHFLNVILATHPELLVAAQKAATAATAEVLDAEDLPEELVSAERLPASPGNAYRVVPPDLNTWEKSFAGALDRDGSESVLWWHRNLPHKPWSVSVLLPDGRSFFPDFVIGVAGRKTEDQALLADPKFGFERGEEAAKLTTRHPVYGRVLVVYLEGGVRWMTVGIDPASGRAKQEREFRVSDMAGF
jgi:type III restriction enzyme